MPITAGSSVNVTKQTCQVDCATTAKFGSHTLNGVCVVDTADPNPACLPDSKWNTGFSLGANKECLADCKNTAEPSKTLNTPGYHAISPKAGDPAACTVDVPAAPASPPKNNDCNPVVAGTSVNVKTEMCEPACENPLMGSHKFNGVCIVDGTAKNTDCAPPFAGYTMNNQTSECQGDCLTAEKSLDDPTKTTNTPGYHNFNSICSADLDSTPINPKCHPDFEKDKSWNAVT